MNVPFVVGPGHFHLSGNLLNDLEEVLTDLSFGAITTVVHTVHKVGQVGSVLSHRGLEPLERINECCVIHSCKSQGKVDNVESCCSAKSSHKGILYWLLKFLSFEFTLEQRQDGDWDSLGGQLICLSKVANGSLWDLDCFPILQSLSPVVFNILFSNFRVDQGESLFLFKLLTLVELFA